MNLKPRVQRIALAGGLFFILSTAHLFTPGQFMDGATYAGAQWQNYMKAVAPSYSTAPFSDPPASVLSTTK